MARAAMRTMAELDVARSYYIYRPLLVVLAKEPASNADARAALLALVDDAVRDGFFDAAARGAVLRAPCFSTADKAKLPAAQAMQRKRSIREDKPRKRDVKGSARARRKSPAPPPK